MTKKILICDDEPAIREVLSMLIEVEFNVEIIFAVDGEEGIEKLKEYQGQIDFIISDMNMPKVKGIDVFRYNKEHFKIPFLLLSADSDFEKNEMEDFSTCGFFTSNLNKPWKEEEFFATLRPFLS